MFTFNASKAFLKALHYTHFLIVSNAFIRFQSII